MTKIQRIEKLERVLAIPESDIQLYKEAFDMFDIDGSGMISIDEMYSVMKNFGNDMTREEIKEMISEIDVDKSGDIDFQEFITLMKKETIFKVEEVHNDLDEEMVKMAFKEFDKDKNGFLSQDQFKYILIEYIKGFTEQEVESIFKQCDLNKDGQLDYNEYVDFWNSF